MHHIENHSIEKKGFERLGGDVIPQAENRAWAEEAAAMGW